MSNTSKKALIIRYGAYGDMLIITPIVKKLKELGYYVILNTTQRGIDVFTENSNVDEFIKHDQELYDEALTNHWQEVGKSVNPDWFCNFSESLEVNIALHPISPPYIYPIKERFEICNKNYYDETEKWANIGECQKLPELYFTDTEIEVAKAYIKPDKYNILWCLSGSGRQKAYPWAEYIMGELLSNYDDIHIITVGDDTCQLLESLGNNNITNLAGRIVIRQAMCLTQLVDLVVSPDTGILHAAGCYDTPKIGLLGHTTKENITKYFKNDYSIEAKCSCSPCFRLIYDHKIQCPIEPVTRGAWCMAVGMPPEVVYDRIKQVKEKHGKRNREEYYGNFVKEYVRS